MNHLELVKDIEQARAKLDALEACFADKPLPIGVARVVSAMSAQIEAAESQLRYLHLEEHAA